MILKIEKLMKIRIPYAWLSLKEMSVRKKCEYTYTLIIEETDGHCSCHHGHDVEKFLANKPADLEGPCRSVS